MSDRALARGRALIALGILGGLVLVVGYVALVRTRHGQTLGDQAYIGRMVDSKKLQSLVSNSLHLINIATVISMVLIFVVVGVARRRLDVALVSSATFAAAIVCAEILKDILPRPALSPLEDELKIGGFNTYPSGHSTIATAFLLGLLLVASPRWRPIIGVVGGLWVAGICVGTLAAGWHRPSDAIGGIAIATLSFGIGAGWLVQRRFVAIDPPPTARWLPWGALAVTALAYVLIAVPVLHGQTVPSDRRISPWAFPLASFAIATYAIATIALVAWLLRDIARPLPASGDTSGSLPPPPPTYDVHPA